MGQENCMKIYNYFIYYNKYKKIFSAIIFFILSIFFTSAFAEETLTPIVNTSSKPFALGWIDEIHSAQLSENRILNVYLPEGYDRNKSLTYPVIYLLDGSADEDFIHIVGIVQFLNMIQALPKSIVVGIANVDRKHDFLSATTVQKEEKEFPTAGGSEKFMAFIEQELEPFIQKKYRTNGYNILIGQSLGGLFATEVLLEKPELFNKYIIISPSLWWNNESLLSKASLLLKKHSKNNIKVYIAVGNEWKKTKNETKKLADILAKSQNKNLTVNYVSFPDENHITILHNSVYKALSSQ